jgi:hypothetical protein
LTFFTRHLSQACLTLLCFTYGSIKLDCAGDSLCNALLVGFAHFREDVDKAAILSGLIVVSDVEKS